MHIAALKFAIVVVSICCLVMIGIIGYGTKELIRVLRNKPLKVKS